MMYMGNLLLGDAGYRSPKKQSMTPYYSFSISVSFPTALASTSLENRLPKDLDLFDLYLPNRISA
jgi:hypothetical protein